MKQVELSHALDLSRAQVLKLVAKGMPTDSVAAAEDWRRSNLDPGKVAGHRMIRKPESRRRHGAEDEGKPNPIDAVVFGVLPQILFDRAHLAMALVDNGLTPSGREVDLIAWAVAVRLQDCLVDGLGFPYQELNLPRWMYEVDLTDEEGEFDDFASTKEKQP